MHTRTVVYRILVAILAIIALFFPYEPERQMLSVILAGTAFALMMFLANEFNRCVNVEYIGIFLLLCCLVVWFAAGAGEGVYLDLTSAILSLLAAVLTYLIFKWEEHLQSKQISKETHQ